MDKVPNPDATPHKVSWSDCAEFENLDERVSAVTVIFGSVIGVNDGYVEWCPDDIPPTEQERLAWVWLCNPTLVDQILPLAEGWFRDLISSYRAGDMTRWWEDAARPDEG